MKDVVSQSKNKRKPLWRYGTSLFVAVGLVAISMTGCTKGALRTESQTASQPHQRPVFRMNLATEPPDLDPAKINDLTSFTVVQNIFRGLTLIDEHSQTVPALATHWQKSADGLTYTFHLNPKAKWSDGKPVVAQQFIDGWCRALDPNIGADYAFFLFEIKGGKALYESMSDESTPNQSTVRNCSRLGAKALGPHQLQVQLERPIPFFLALMASPIALPVRLDQLQRDGDQFTEAGKLITNGPYQLKEWIHEEKIVLTPDPFYDGPKPQVDAVEMLMINDANTSVIMYENNELDFIETTSSIPGFDVRRLKQRPETRSFPIHRINYIGFNTEQPPFNNPKVRQAFALAMDRSYYPRLLKSGEQATSSWISPGLMGYNPKRGLSFNPKKAQKLLAEAGYPNGKGFPVVSLGYPTKYDIQKEAEIAQFLWKKHLNVPVRLENMEWKVYLSRLKDDPPALFRLGWFVDYPDPDSFMAMMTHDSGNNHTRWQNPQYDRWVQQAAITQDPTHRQALYDQAQRLLLEEDTAMIPLYVAEKTYLVKPWVKGFKINAINLINLDQLQIHQLQAAKPSYSQVEIF